MLFGALHTRLAWVCCRDASGTGQLLWVAQGFSRLFLGSVQPPILQLAVPRVLFVLLLSQVMVQGMFHQRGVNQTLLTD